jgi:DNA-binding GntR family transcriptional regulator
VPNLDPNLVWQLFEARSEIEQSVVRLVADRATVEELEQLHVFVDSSAAASPDGSVDDLLALDRQFHESLAALTRNVELARILKNLNDRIQLVRWIAMEGKRQTTQDEHRAIVQALLARDGEKAARLVGAHIMHRSDEIFAAVKRAYAHAHTKQYDAFRQQDAADIR